MEAPPKDIPASELRREGSTWQGGRHAAGPEWDTAQRSADLALNAWLGQFTAHVSPAALALAWQDWASHLALSPDKQMELALLAQSSIQHWLEYGAAAAGRQAVEPLQPLA